VPVAESCLRPVLTDVRPTARTTASACREYRPTPEVLEFAFLVYRPASLDILLSYLSRSGHTFVLIQCPNAAGPDRRGGSAAAFNEPGFADDLGWFAAAPAAKDWQPVCGASGYPPHLYLFISIRVPICNRRAGHVRRLVSLPIGCCASSVTDKICLNCFNDIASKCNSRCYHSEVFFPHVTISVALSKRLGQAHLLLHMLH
jgi:hypothetical protein